MIYHLRIQRLHFRYSAIVLFLFVIAITSIRHSHHFQESLGKSRDDGIESQNVGHSYGNDSGIKSGKEGFNSLLIDTVDNTTDTKTIITCNACNYAQQINPDALITNVTIKTEENKSKAKLFSGKKRNKNRAHL